MAIRIDNQPARMESSHSDDLTTGFRMIGFLKFLWRAARVRFAKADGDTNSRSLTPLSLSASPPLSLPLSLFCLSLSLPLPLSVPRSLSLPRFYSLCLSFMLSFPTMSLILSPTHPSPYLSLSLSLSLIISFSVVP